MRSVCLLFEDESDRTQSFKASSWASKDSVPAGLRRAMVAGA